MEITVKDANTSFKDLLTSSDASNQFNAGVDQGVAKWEWRVFWPEGSPPPFKFEDLPKIAGQRSDVPVTATAEKNSDTYILLPGSDNNLKVRDGCVADKVPVSAIVDLALPHPQTDVFTGYKKKQSFDFPIDAAAFKQLTGLSVPAEMKIASAQEFISTVKSYYPDAKIVPVEKERQGATLQCPKKSKDGFNNVAVEACSLKIGEQKFWSFCLEGKNPKFLEGIIKQLPVGNNGHAMDYVDFLSHTASAAGAQSALTADDRAGQTKSIVKPLTPGH